MKIAIFLLAFVCGTSHAAIATISAVPTTWSAENYVPGYVVLWFTGSVCGNGQLSLPSSANSADHNRLYATVMSAKASNTKVTINYDNAVAGCPISSFSIQ